jgi:hypothetical protein
MRLGQRIIRVDSGNNQGVFESWTYLGRFCDYPPSHVSYENIGYKETAGDSSELSCVSSRQGYTSSTAVDEPIINILRVLLSALEKYVRQ